MPTYVYETIPVAGDGREPQVFEHRQSIHDEPLTAHPETGQPVRRVITGGIGILGASPKSAPAPASPSGGCCAGGACGCAN